MLRRHVLSLLVASWFPLSAWAECNPLPAELVDMIPVGLWRPSTEREWMNVGLISFSSKAIRLGGNRYRLCFVEKLPSRGEVSVDQGGASSPSDVLVFSIVANKGQRPYSNSGYLGVSQFSMDYQNSTKQNWVEAYWCQKLEHIEGGRFWCSVNDYVCESGACLQP